MATEINEVCEICGKTRDNHSTEETKDCVRELVNMGIMKFCGLCGVTRPAEGVRDMCSKCGEKYAFVNR